MGKRKKEGYISLWVEPEFKKALENHAIKDRRTLSNLIEKILDDWLREQAKSERPTRRRAANHE